MLPNVPSSALRARHKDRKLLAVDNNFIVCRERKVECRACCRFQIFDRDDYSLVSLKDAPGDSLRSIKGRIPHEWEIDVSAGCIHPGITPDHQGMLAEIPIHRLEIVGGHLKHHAISSQEAVNRILNNICAGIAK